MPKITVSEYTNVTFVGDNARCFQAHTTVLPNGRNIGRIDAMMCKSVKDIVARVKKQIIRDGSEFGTGLYVINVSHKAEIIGLKDLTTTTIEIRVEA